MVLSICTQKGGVGKTTTSLALSAGLAQKGKKVLLVDFDPQANASKVVMGNLYSQLASEDSITASILDKKPLKIHTTSINNLWVVPSHILLADTDIKLTTAFDHREARLKGQLDDIKDEFDYVFIDCPPSLNWLTINAFTASDKAIAIISPGYFELESTVQLLKLLKDVQVNFNSHIELWGFVFTMADSTIASRNSLSILRQTYPGRVFNTLINKNTDVRDAHMAKKDIFTYNPRSRAAQDYQRLINELFITAK